ncbi:MAG: hypothetical protein U0K81_05050 [Paludibacteraceae bacterium]|nr:hypothetical protein [Paludibacteraceae bacterium]
METKSLNTAIRWTNLKRVLEEFAEYFITAYRDNLERFDANASGKLSKSLKYEIKSGASFLAVDVSLLHYWKYVEYGRRAGGKMPPISAIERWIRVRKIVPYANNGRVPTIKQLAYLIAHKIAVEGIKPRSIFANSLDEAVAEFERAIEEAITQDIEEVVDIELLIL